MSERAAALADRFERAVDAFLDIVAGVSEEQWRTTCPTDDRTVGVLTHHVAAAMPFQLRVFRDIAAGRQPATLSHAQLAEINAQDADAWAGCTKTETLALLRSNAVAAADEVRHWNDEQLFRSGRYLDEIAEPWPVEQWLEHLLIGHIYEHAKAIQATVASNHPM
jgi:hypothetical protein